MLKYLVILNLYAKSKSLLCDKLCAQSWIWVFLPFFSADPLKLCQVVWGPSVGSHFQVSSEMANWVQVRALAGPIKDIHRVVPKPLLHCLGCVLRVIVLLEGEASARFSIRISLSLRSDFPQP